MMSRLLFEFLLRDSPYFDALRMLDMPVLQAANIERTASNIEVLRQHPALKYLGWGPEDRDGAANCSKLTTAEFWKRCAAQKAAGRK